jgi:hypothetical protein
MSFYYAVETLKRGGTNHGQLVPSYTNTAGLGIIKVQVGDWTEYFGILGRSTGRPAKVVKGKGGWIQAIL